MKLEEWVKQHIDKAKKENGKFNFKAYLMLKNSKENAAWSRIFKLKKKEVK